MFNIKHTILIIECVADEIMKCRQFVWISTTRLINYFYIHECIDWYCYEYIILHFIDETIYYCSIKSEIDRKTNYKSFALSAIPYALHITLGISNLWYDIRVHHISSPYCSADAGLFGIIMHEIIITIVIVVVWISRVNDHRHHVI